MVGLFILLATALAVMIVLLTAMLAREMRRPPRHTAAYALAKGLPCDPGDLNPPLPFEEWWLDRPDGAQLPVWDISNPAVEIKDSNLVAVFVHGWGHSRVDVLPRVDIVRPFCHRMIISDLRGHGDSRQGLSNLGMNEDEDLLALLERLGDVRVVLMGHSMGAVIALKAAAEAHRRKLPATQQIAGIVAYGAYCEFHRSLQGRLRVAGYPARPITDLALVALRMGGLKPLSLNESDVKAIECPILLIHGCEDRVSPLEHSQRLARAAKRATLHEIEDAAHVDAHTIDAQRHDGILNDFLHRLTREPQRETTFSHS